ncbi:MAG: recombinase family protein [Clostridia bacterium]|nr:recombinase family protein [Clostridia bacterium]
MYAIYLRKSRKDRELEKPGEAETLARHENALTELAKKKNFTVSHIYREVVSGETIEARPEMQKLLKAVEAGVYKGVLVMEVERLARGNTKDQGIVAEAFQFSGTLIITPSKTYDPSDEFDQEYFEFGLFMSRREYKTINRRIQQGRLASVQEGKYIASSAPLGYNKVKIKGEKGYTLEPNKDAETVKLIYSLYTDSRNPSGMQLIAKRLDELGIKPQKSANWSRASVKDILTNPTYTGKVRWQWRKVNKTVENGKIVKHRPKRKPDEYMLIDGLHPAIISQEMFNKAQAILKGKYIPPVADNRDMKNPLAGLLICEKCGAKMTRVISHTGDFVKCSNIKCNNISSKTELVEKAVIEAAEDWLAGYILNFTDKYVKQDYTNHINIIKNYKDKINLLNKQLVNTYDLLEQGIYTTALFKQRNTVLQNDINETTKFLNKAQAEYEHKLSEDAIMNSFIPVTEKLINAYYRLNSAKPKNDILHEVLEKVTYIKTKKGTRNKPAPFKIKIYPKILKSQP